MEDLPVDAEVREAVACSSSPALGELAMRDDTEVQQVLQKARPRSVGEIIDPTLASGHRLSLNALHLPHFALPRWPRSRRPEQPTDTAW